jgi:16S rRNA G966 N2-methylase RsmD
MVDLVYIDPPYDKVQVWAKPLIELLGQVVRPHGKIIFESRGGQDTELVREVVASSEHFQWIKSKKFGEVGITVCERNPV